MKKLLLISALTLTASMNAFAADALHNTQWQTIDDETKKPKAVVSIKEVNGKLQGTITQYKKGGVCKVCKGKYKNKSLVGVKVFWSLKPNGKGSYSGGKIFDPKKEKAYKLKGKLIKGGKKLELRGYVGTPLFGRTQTWNRIK